MNPVTRAPPHPDGYFSADIRERSDANSKSKLDRRLDLALEDTFPASDPFSIIISDHVQSGGDN